jgi:hypothetical protein
MGSHYPRWCAVRCATTLRPSDAQRKPCTGAIRCRAQMSLKRHKSSTLSSTLAAHIRPMQHARRSAETAKTRAVVPWWTRNKQLRISFPDPPEPSTPGTQEPMHEPTRGRCGHAPARHIPGIPEHLQATYRRVFGVPALLMPDASDRAAVHPEAANEREGRNHG